MSGDNTSVASSRPSLKRVLTPILEIAYEESGSSDSVPVVLLHGWPYDIRQYDEVRNILVSRRNARVLVPYLRGFGPTRYLQDANTTKRSGQQTAVAQDVVDFLDALSIQKAILVGYDWGGRAACIVAALHPDRVAGLLTCQGYSIFNIPKASSTALPPVKVRRFWYQKYFNTKQGINGLAETRYDLCKLLWKEWSPHWDFTEDEYGLTAESFENPDWVDTVIHSYRHRYGNVEGDERYASVEAAMEKQPSISVPTVILSGAVDAVEPPEQSDPFRDKFTGYYFRKVLPKVGHCPPVEDADSVAHEIEKLMDFR